MFDDAIDRAIFDVARQMTAGEPSADLRARVLARVGERAVAGGRVAAGVEASWIQTTVWRGAFTAAAITLIVVAAYRESRPGPPKPDTTAVVRAPDVSAVRTPVPERAGTAVNPSGPALHTQAIGRLRASQPRVAIQPSSLDALAPPELQFTSLDVAGNIDARPLDVPPLEPIAPISVAPLDEGDRR